MKHNQLEHKKHIYSFPFNGNSCLRWPMDHSAPRTVPIHTRYHAKVWNRYYFRADSPWNMFRIKLAIYSDKYTFNLHNIQWMCLIFSLIIAIYFLVSLSMFQWRQVAGDAAIVKLAARMFSPVVLLNRYFMNFSWYHRIYIYLRAGMTSCLDWFRLACCSHILFVQLLALAKPGHRGIKHQRRRRSLSLKSAPIDIL